ncbi:MAG: replicative DNA helicase [Clostridia bacterium]|nr:replicative DNA helicase [Clostridia bacterium]
MNERIPPHSEDAEKSVLGAAMLSKDALFDVMEVVTAKDFYSDAHREIFEAITELYRKSLPVDMLTVCEELRKRKSLEMVGGRAYIAALSGSVPATSNAKEYAKIISEKAAMRALITAADEIMEQGFRDKADPADVLDFAEKSIFEIAQKNQRKDFAPLKEILLENLKSIDEAAQNQGNITGVPSGFAAIDKITAGFQKSDLIIIAARPSMGKTAFALNVAQKAAMKADASVMIFSLEMSKEQLSQRLLSMESRIDTQKIRTGNLSRKDWDDLQNALDTLSKAKIFIDDTPGIRIMEIKNKCRRLKAEKGLDLVLIDYLQLMSMSGKTESRQQEISALSRNLKQLARELECPVIVLSQLSRAPELRSDHHPQLADLRESGSIEQDADIVIMLYRDEYYNKEESEKPGICEVSIEKHRAGELGKVELAWIGKNTRFVDVSNENVPG